MLIVNSNKELKLTVSFIALLKGWLEDWVKENDAVGMNSGPFYTQIMVDNAFEQSK